MAFLLGVPFLCAYVVCKLCTLNFVLQISNAVSTCILKFVFMGHFPPFPLSYPLLLLPPHTLSPSLSLPALPGFILPQPWLKQSLASIS